MRALYRKTARSPEMLPTFRMEDGFLGAVDQEDLVLEPRIDDFADTRHGDALNRWGKIRRDDDQFVLFTAVEDVALLDPRRCRKAILVDSR